MLQRKQQLLQRQQLLHQYLLPRRHGHPQQQNLQYRDWISALDVQPLWSPEPSFVRNAVRKRKEDHLGPLRLQPSPKNANIAISAVIQYRPKVVFVSGAELQSNAKLQEQFQLFFFFLFSNFFMHFILIISHPPVFYASFLMTGGVSLRKIYRISRQSHPDTVL